MRKKIEFWRKKSKFLSLCYPRDAWVLSDFCPFGPVVWSRRLVQPFRPAIWSAVAKISINERRALLCTHLWHLSKSKFKLKSNRDNLVAPASPIQCLLYLPYVRTIQTGTGKVDPDRKFKCTIRPPVYIDYW